jgi:hypothetical protein
VHVFLEPVVAMTFSNSLVDLMDQSLDLGSICLLVDEIEIDEEETGAETTRGDKDVRNIFIIITIGEFCEFNCNIFVTLDYLLHPAQHDPNNLMDAALKTRPLQELLQFGMLF